MKLYVRISRFIQEVIFPVSVVLFLVSVVIFPVSIVILTVSIVKFIVHFMVHFMLNLRVSISLYFKYYEIIFNFLVTIVSFTFIGYGNWIILEDVESFREESISVAYVPIVSDLAVIPLHDSDSAGHETSYRDAKHAGATDFVLNKNRTKVRYTAMLSPQSYTIQHHTSGHFSNIDGSQISEGNQTCERAAYREPAAQVEPTTSSVASSSSSKTNYTIESIEASTNEIFFKVLRTISDNKISLNNSQKVRDIVFNFLINDSATKKLWLASNINDLRQGPSEAILSTLSSYAHTNMQKGHSDQDQKLGMVAAHIGTCIAIINSANLQKVPPDQFLNADIYGDFFKVFLGFG